MLPYTIVVLIAILFTYFAQLSLSKSKLLFAFFSILALGALEFLAVARDYKVGYDFRYYFLRHISNAARSESLGDCISNVRGAWGYCTMLYCTTRISDSPRLATAAIALITYGFAYLGCIKLRDKLPLSLSFALFLLLMYMNSFNLIRQSAAIGLSLYAYSLYRGKWGGLKFYLAAILAMSFHSTAIIVPCVVIYANVVSYMSPPKRKLFLLLTVGISVLIVATFAVILQTLADTILLFDHYTTYTDSQGTATWQQPGLPKFLLLAMFFCLSSFFIAHKQNGISDADFYKFLVIVILNASFMVLGIYTSSITRLAMYFSHICMFSAVYSILHFVNHTRNTNCIIICFFVFLVVISSFFKEGIASPYLYYKSSILGI